jgi:hypothetical protein
MRYVDLRRLQPHELPDIDDFCLILELADPVDFLVGSLIRPEDFWSVWRADVPTGCTMIAKARRVGGRWRDVPVSLISTLSLCGYQIAIYAREDGRDQCEGCQDRCHVHLAGGYIEHHC